jgi:cytochrome c oxidase cbb3-type subunit 4
METYTAMRHFADSWALLAMTLFFIGVVVFAFRPGSRKQAETAASIPLNDDQREQPR